MGASGGPIRHGSPAEADAGPNRSEPPWTPTTLPLTDDEKHRALEQVLQSATFLRAGQLRSFLRYVGEMELAGRAAELSEYLIGVEALGRPAGYSTADDSSVRRQAHALRQKLQEVYVTEIAEAVIRVHLPKGSYVPRFARASAPTAGGALETPERADRDEAMPERTARRAPGAALLLAAFAVGVLVTVAAVWTVGRASAARAVPGGFPRVLDEAWGPLARPGANVLICLATPPHLVVLPYPDGPLPALTSILPPLPEEPTFRQWYREHYPLEPTDRLGIHKTTGPIRLGDVNGLITAVRALDRLGVDFQIVAEKNMGLPALRGRNLVLFGNPDYSFAASKLLERTFWTIAYDPETRQRIIRPRDPASGRTAVYAPVRDSRGWLSDVFGLITVLPSEGAPESSPMRTAIFSCTNDSGCQAAMEFFASATQMQDLRDRFHKDGRGFPPAYQVVVRCRVQSGQTISGEYGAHVVLN
jgi:hypothetical protein